MADFLSEFEHSLAYMFELQPQKMDKYLNPAVERLKNALNNFKNSSKVSAQELVEAVQAVLPVIVKYDMDLYTIKAKLQLLVGKESSSINWDIPAIANRYSFFQFSTAPKMVIDDFIVWLSKRSGRDFLELLISDQVELMIAERAEREFAPKLAEHLRTDPDFLFNLILSSPENFTAIMDTRIGFQLQDQQVARAIYQHFLQPLHDQEHASQTLSEQIEVLERCLAKTGRSIEKLLAEPLAREELERSTELLDYLQSSCSASNP